ncbi:hypothetical protein AX17_001691 [Amanita inopinata Kibby_2008]|nr:hypothetical protein AX17_001691 [Amanita inopinata Kibby_2008]
MEVPVGSQIFDLVFHPTFATVYTGLLTGHIKAFAYDDKGNHEEVFNVRPSKRSCRGLSINEDGTQLYAVGKARSFNIVDTKTQDVDARVKAHDSPINRVKYLMPGLISTGDDEGVIKLWDPRQRDCLRTYNQHFDYITDFLWLDDKKQLVATSGDGTLSVMDIKSKKAEPIAHSEDQEDELLSIVAIKSGTKAVVGTQLGVLSIFNRNKGWGDCVDRVPGHPLSIDALCNLPRDIPDVDSGSTILTGSSDGYVRAVHLFPTELLGVVTDHGEWPVERIAIGEARGQLTLEKEVAGVTSKGKDKRRGNGSDSEEETDVDICGPWWVGSVGHEEVLRMSDLGAFFRKGNDRERHASVEDELEVDNEGSQAGDEDTELEAEGEDEDETAIGLGEVAKSDDEEGITKPKKRRRKPEKEPLKVKKRKGKNEVEVEGEFFSEL